MDELLEQQLERIAKLSHDLKGPLNTIYSAFQILKMSDSEEMTRDSYYQAAERNIRRMTRLIDHFTNYYSMTNQGAKLNAKMIDGRRLVESLCVAVKDSLENVNVELETDIEGNGMVCLDELMIESAFLNLVSNGIKATKEDPCKIKVHASFDQGDLLLSVRDFGIGIEEKDQQRIFEPLVQLNSLDKGTGLGLSIVAEIVQLHGGEILLESAPGEGSTFTLKIPCQIPVESKRADLKQFDPDMDRLQRAKLELADLL